MPLKIFDPTKDHTSDGPPAEPRLVSNPRPPIGVLVQQFLQKISSGQTEECDEALFAIRRVLQDFLIFVKTKYPDHHPDPLGPKGAA